MHIVSLSSRMTIITYVCSRDCFRGAFSVVRRCVQKSTGHEFAAKIINTMYGPVSSRRGLKLADAKLPLLDLLAFVAANVSLLK